MEAVIIILIVLNVIALFLYFRNFFSKAQTANDGIMPFLLELQKIKAEVEFGKKLEDERKTVMEKIDQITEKIKKEFEGETKDNLIAEEKKTQIIGQTQENKPTQQSIQMSEENLKILRQLQGIQKKKVDERRKEFADKMKIIEKEQEELEKGKKIVEERIAKQEVEREFDGGNF